MRYLLDGDATPDRSTEAIWLMGVKLSGWGKEEEERVAAAASSSSSGHAPSAHHPHITHRGHKHGLPRTSHGHNRPQRPSTRGGCADVGPWPATFFALFYAQVWCAYRAAFEPIRDLPSLASLPPLFSLTRPRKHPSGIPPCHPIPRRAHSAAP
ncbi:hypothetical protein DFH06DRAFT_60040 [Mycena polygramma]|nr:hypothetical protein DFH06DRAFT_60040 [Mycena polygramma]